MSHGVGILLSASVSRPPQQALGDGLQDKVELLSSQRFYCKRFLKSLNVCNISFFFSFSFGYASENGFKGLLFILVQTRKKH